MIVDRSSGVNDYLDRDGSRTPVTFHISNDHDVHPLDAEVVQAATKWKRLALRQFGCEPGEGILTDMRAVRKDYFLDHDHSAYVDQWDWERAIRREDRTLEYLTETVRAIWRALKAAETMLLAEWPALAEWGTLPDELEFIHAEDLLAAYPDLPRKQRETQFLQEHPAVFIYGIGWTLADGLPHELRAADYDDWSTETLSADGRPMHGLNGDILVWNPVTKRRHELMSGGIRVDAESLRRQLELSGQTQLVELPYHRAILRDELPLSIGSGIGQARTMMLLLRKAHLGEVSVSVWPARPQGALLGAQHPRARVKACSRRGRPARREHQAGGDRARPAPAGLPRSSDRRGGVRPRRVPAVLGRALARGDRAGRGACPTSPGCASSSSAAGWACRRSSRPRAGRR